MICTATVPGEWAGIVQVSEVGRALAVMGQWVPPTVTVAPARSPVPVRVSEVLDPPKVGETLVKVGAAL